MYGHYFAGIESPKQLLLHPVAVAQLGLSQFPPCRPHLQDPGPILLYAEPHLLLLLLLPETSSISSQRWQSFQVSLEMLMIAIVLLEVWITKEWFHLMFYKADFCARCQRHKKLVICITYKERQ